MIYSQWSLQVLNCVEHTLPSHHNAIFLTVSNKNVRITFDLSDVDKKSRNNLWTGKIWTISYGSMIFHKNSVILLQNQSKSFLASSNYVVSSAYLPRLLEEKSTVKRQYYRSQLKLVFGLLTLASWPRLWVLRKTLNSSGWVSTARD